MSKFLVNMKIIVLFWDMFWDVFWDTFWDMFWNIIKVMIPVLNNLFMVVNFDAIVETFLNTVVSEFVGETCRQ